MQCEPTMPAARANGSASRQEPFPWRPVPPPERASGLRRSGSRDFALELSRCLTNAPGGQAIDSVDEAVEKRFVADGVDQPRYAARVSMNRPDRPGSKARTPVLRAGDPKAMR